MKKTYLPFIFVLAAPFYPHFEGEGEGSGEGSGDNGAGDPPAGDPPAGGKKTFTQDEVNTLMATNRKKLQQDYTEKAKALVDAQSNLNLTQEERDVLANKLNDLESTLLTTKELAERERKKLQEESKNALNTTAAERDLWKNRHHNMLVATAITNASMLEGQKAINPSQLVALFRSDASVVEVDGELVVQMKVNTVSTDGTQKTLTLDPAAAIKEYAARPDYMNLFDIPGKDGLNRQKPNFSTGNGGVLPKTLAEYKAARTEIVN